MKRIRFSGVFRHVILIIGFCINSMAQTYQGRILGTVNDQSGAIIRSAKVVITNVDTGISRNLETNEAGDYVAPNLPPGLYTITAEAPGFKKVERTSVRLEVAKDLRIDFTLVPGEISESISISAEPPLVETTNDILGGTFSNKAINDLPLNGRDYQNLLVLRPGVTRSAGGGFLSISSNGNRPEDNNYIVDGTDNNDPYYGTTVINTEGVQGTPGSILPIDAIQEFNVQESPTAEYGWKPGAIANVGLKSGTNELHGTGYGFERNNALDARNYLNTKPDPKRALRQHQFGGSIGGPITPNKLFYFGAYEGVRGFLSNTNTISVPATVPLGGPTSNCTFVATGDCGASIPDAIADLAANGIPVNPLSANLIGLGAFTGNGPYPGLFPVNDGTNPAGPATINSGFPNVNRSDSFIIKLDHHINDRHNLTGRYFLGDSLQIEQDQPVQRPEWRSQSQYRAQVFGVNWNWTPNPRWVNEAKFGFNRFWQAILTVDHDKDPVKTYGINTGVTRPINFGMPTIRIGGFSTDVGGGTGWPLLTIPNQTFQFADNLSYTLGKHTIRFGGEYRHGTTDNIRNRRGKGRIRFSNGGNVFATSTPLEDFLAGFPDKGDIFVGDSERHISIDSFGGFLQDDFRVTPRLTINMGLRYDLNKVIKERDNLLGNFDPAVGLQQVGVNISSPYNGDHNNFSPRLGIAWDPWGKGKTVFRFGGGITYEIPHISIFIGQNGVNNGTTTGLNSIPTGAIGSNIAGTIVSAATTQRSGLNWTPEGPIFNVSVNCDPAAGGTPCDILGIDRNLRTPYVFNWNFNVQQALTNTTSLQVAYVANKGTKLYSIRDINQVDPTSPAEIACDHCEQDGRPYNAKFPFLGFINFMENGYVSNYQALQVTLTQRPWHGLGYVAGYTWSHIIDQVSLNRGFQPQNSLNLRAERGSGDYDIRHRFTLALTYDLPGRKTRSQLLEGWQVTSIVTLQGGTPFSAIDFENDSSLTGEYSDRYDVIGSAKSIPNWSSSGPVPVDQVLAQPSCPPCFGNSGRNLFRGPGLYVWDFSLVKNWKLSERVSMQLRGEFFNFLNHPNFASPAPISGTFYNYDLGIPEEFGFSPGSPDVVGANPVIGTGGPRNIQIGLKFRF